MYNSIVKDYLLTNCIAHDIIAYTSNRAAAAHSGPHAPLSALEARCTLEATSRSR